MFGNFMAVAVIESLEHLKRLQSNVFLSVLALLSNLFLLTLFIIWIEPFFPSMEAYNASNVIGCKIITYLAHCADFGCVWLIVLVCIDRVMVLKWPEHRVRIYTTISPRMITLILVVAVLVINSWLLVVALPLEEKGEACTVS